MAKRKDSKHKGKRRKGGIAEEFREIGWSLKGHQSCESIAHTIVNNNPQWGLSETRFHRTSTGVMSDGSVAS